MLKNGLLTITLIFTLAAGVMADSEAGVQPYKIETTDAFLSTLMALPMYETGRRGWSI